MPLDAKPETDWEFYKLIIQGVGYAVTWIIVFVGWQVAHSQNAKRDQRKELRDQVDLLTQHIRTVESDVVTYLTSIDETTSVSYWAIYFGVQRINSSITRIDCFSEKYVIDALIDFRKAVTSKAISGPNSTKPVDQDLDEALKEVSRKSNGLIQVMEARYLNHYPPKK